MTDAERLRRSMDAMDRGIRGGSIRRIVFLNGAGKNRDIIGYACRVPSEERKPLTKGCDHD